MNLPEMEIGFINCVLQDPDLLDDVMHRVDINDFTNKRKDIFKVIKSQYMESGGLSRTKFMMKAKDKLPDLDVEDLFETNFAFAMELDDIVDKLNDYKLRRSILAGIKEVHKKVKDEEMATDKLRSTVENIMLNVTSGEDSGKAIKTLEEVAEKSYAKLNERIDRQEKGEEIERLKTYYPKLDTTLEGFKPGHLTILAGATSSGKTAFAINIMKNILQNTDKPVYFISLEMNDVELFDRILISESKVSASDFSLGDMNKGQEKSINHGFNKIFEKQALITDQPGLNLNQIKSLSRRANKQYDNGLGLIIIDYLTMIDMKSLDNYKTIGKTVTGIRNLAKELQVPILLLHQLNRNLHKRNNPKPKLSDLRDSGEIEERADEIMFVHRPEYFRMKDSDESESKIQTDVEIVVGKNRTGRTGNVPFTWYPEILTFQDGYLYDNNGAIQYLSKKKEGDN